MIHKLNNLVISTAPKQNSQAVIGDAPKYLICLGQESLSSGTPILKSSTAMNKKIIRLANCHSQSFLQIRVQSRINGEGMLQIEHSPHCLVRFHFAREQRRQG